MSIDNCKWKIDEQIFTSKKALDDYIKSSKYYSDKYSDVVFEKSDATITYERVKRIESEAGIRAQKVRDARKKESTIKKEIKMSDLLDEKYPGENIIDVYSDDYMSVLNYIYQHKLIKPFDVNEYKRHRPDILLEAYNNKLNSKYLNDNKKISKKLSFYPEVNQDIVDQVLQEITQEEIESWSYIKKIGKTLDAIFGIAFNGRGQLHRHFWDGEHFNISKFLEDYATYNKESSWYDLEGLIDEDGNSRIIDNYIRQLLDLKSTMNLRPGDELISQMDIDYKETYDPIGIRGKIDFVIVRMDGSIDIYDIKASSKQSFGLDPILSEWDQDKILAAEYQLEFYRKILQSNGLYNTNIRTHIIPIYLKNIEYNKNGSTLEDIRVDNIIDLEPNSEVLGNTSFIRNRPEVSIEANKIKSDINSEMQKVFPSISIGDQILNVDEEYLIRTGEIKDLGNGKYGFYKYKGSIALQELMKFDSLSEAMKAFEPEYKRRREEFREILSVRIGELKNKLERFNSTSEKYDFDKEELFQGVRQNIQAEFRKYLTEPGWSILEDEDTKNALEELGIVVLKNDSISENGPIFDFICMTDTYLDKTIKLKLGNTIFGNHKYNKHVGKAPKANIGNILLYRNMIAANTLAKYMPDSRFGDFMVVKMYGNSKTTEFTSMKLSGADLYGNFQKLSSIGNITNELDSSRFLSNEEIFYHSFNSIADQDFYDQNGITLNKNIKRTISSFSNIIGDDNSFNIFGKMNPNHKVYFLEKIKPLFESMTKHFKESGISDQELIEGVSLEHHIYRELAKIITKSSGLWSDFYNEDSITEWGFEGNLLRRITEKQNFLHGTKTGTIDTIPIIRAIHERLQQSNQEIRSEYEKYKNKENRDQFKNVGLGNNITSMTGSRRFYDMSERGKREFLFLNPEDKSNNLNDSDRKFLSWYLFEINKKRLRRNPTDDDKESSEYYEVPLLRTSIYSKAVNSNGFWKWITNPKEIMQRMTEDVHNLANRTYSEEDSQSKETNDYRDIIQMYEMFGMDSVTRSKLLSRTNGDPASKYEMNMEVLLDEFAKARIVENSYNKVLPGVSASLYTLQTLGYLSGVNVKESSDFIMKHVKSAIFNESLLPKDQLLTAIQSTKGITGGAILGFNALSGGKEVLNGIFYHYTRSVANNLTDKDKVGLKDITKAYTTVWLDAGKQIATITKIEKLNNRFGMSNMTIDNMTDAQNYFKSDPLRFKSGLYWMNRAPDFLNRMTIMTGYLYKYDAYDAYSVDPDTDELKYDWKKDGRFNLLSSNNKSNMKAYLDQEALYGAMMQDFVEQGQQVYDPELKSFRTIRWDSSKSFNNPDNDSLPDAFTNRQIRSIRQESDRAFGYMDNDTKSLMYKEGITAVFWQFRTFASAKLSQWLLPPDVYDQGKYKQVTDESGNLLYQLPYQNEDETWDVKYVTTPTAEIDGKTVDLKPLVQWEGEWMKGIWWSIQDLLFSFNKAKYIDAWRDPLNRRNLIIAAQELFIILLIMGLITGLYGGAKEISRLDNFFERNTLTMINNSSRDLKLWDSVFAGSITLDFAAYEYLLRAVPDFGGALLGIDHNSWAKWAARNVGATSTFRKELWDIHNDIQTSKDSQ